MSFFCLVSLEVEVSWLDELSKTWATSVQSICSKSRDRLIDDFKLSYVIIEFIYNIPCEL